MFDFDTYIDRHGSDSIKWERQTRACGREGLDPYWIADSDWAAPPCITKALQERVAHPIYGYTYPSSAYMKAVCDWFKDRHGWELQPQWIMPGIGVMTAMALAIAELTEPGEQVVALTPVYDSFFIPVRGMGRELVSVPLREENLRYEIDFPALERAFEQGAKVLLFCNPHNPVGRVWRKKELLQLIELCNRYGIWILSDDSHCDLAANGHQYVPIGKLPGGAERTITFTSPSKAFNIAGVGSSNTVISDDALRARMSGCFMAHLVRGSHVFAYTACRAAYSEGGPWLDEQLKYLAGNEAYIRTFVEAYMEKVRLTPWEGTFLLWMDFRASGKSSQEVAALLAEKYGVAFGRGDGYGLGGNGFLRLNIACPRSRLEALCEKLKDFHKDVFDNS